MHGVDDLVVCLDDVSGHIGWHVNEFDGFYGGYGVGQRNLKEESY